MQTFLLLGALVFASACGSKADGAVSEMESFKSKMCECKDKACAEGVQKDIMEFGKKMKDSGVKKDDLSDDQKAKLKDLRKEFEGCMSKLMKP